MTTTFFTSPYIEVGTTDCTNPDGREMTPAYRASDAKTLLIPTRIAQLLRDPRGISSDQVTPNELAALLHQRLICQDPGAERSRQYEVAQRASTEVGLRKFVLMPTSYCNMGCAYCGQEHVRGATTSDHRDAVTARVTAALADPDTHSVTVRWFGGEPLMAFAAIRSMSKEIVEAAERCDSDYSSMIITNGALLDLRKLRTLAHECAIRVVNITLDGIQEVHDRHRPLKSGKGSYDRITQLLSTAVDLPEFDDVAFLIRTNVDVHNDGHVVPFLDEMAALGLANRKNVSFELHEIHPWGNDVRQLQMKRKEYATKEIEWLARMDQLGLAHTVLPTTVKKNVCVAASREAEVIDASGGVYSCTEQPLVPGFEHTQLTTLDQLGVSARRPRGEFDSWAASVASGQQRCSTCSLLPVCGGACPKSWADWTPACPSLRSNIDQRLLLIAQRQGLTPIVPNSAATTPAGTLA
jgi:uncharacterized protein